MVKIGQDLIVGTGIAVCSQKLEGREYEKESEKLMFKTEITEPPYQAYGVANGGKAASTAQWVDSLK